MEENKILEILKEILNLFNKSETFRSLEIELFKLAIKLGHKFNLSDLKNIIINKFNSKDSNTNLLDKLEFLKLIKELYPEFYDEIHTFWKEHDKATKKVKVSDYY